MFYTDDEFQKLYRRKENGKPIAYLRLKVSNFKLYIFITKTITMLFLSIVLTRIFLVSKNTG